MNVIQGIIIGIVEGITEFLPISSTGHMIIFQKLLGIENNDFVNLFTVNIQLGAIFSVVVLYRKRFVRPRELNATDGNAWRSFTARYDFYLKLLVACIPAVTCALLFGSLIDRLLGSVLVVAVSLLAGGILLLFVDGWFDSASDDQEISYAKSFNIGMFQVVSMIPGVSRAAATIVGGLAQRLNRKNAAEFSFFLAVPTMLGASAYEMFRFGSHLTRDNISLLLIGNVVAFLVAMLAIRAFVGYLSRHGFRIFGYYRIAVGIIILILLFLGVDLQITA